MIWTLRTTLGCVSPPQLHKLRARPGRSGGGGATINLATNCFTFIATDICDLWRDSESRSNFILSKKLKLHNLT